MRMSEEELRDGLKERNRRTRDGTAECLSSGELVSLSLNEVSGDDRPGFIEHLAACSDCAMEFKALSDVREWAEDAAGQISPAAPETTLLEKISGMFGSLPRLAAVSTGILVAGVFSIWLFSSNDIPTETNADNHRGAASALFETVPENSAVLSNAPQKLSWKPSESASYYRAVIYDFESTKIWESRKTKSHEVDVPPEIVSKITTGRVYYWRIFTFNGVTRQSELLRFEVKPRVP